MAEGALEMQESSGPQELRSRIKGRGMQTEGQGLRGE